MVYTESQDNSFDICEKYFRQDKRFKLVKNEENIRSAGHARNLGLKNATGNYIGFVDSDDFIAQDMYQLLITKIEKYGADIAVCKETRKKTDLLQMEFNETILNCAQAKESFLIGKLFYGEVWNKLYRTEVINDLFIESFSVAEDVYFVWKSLNKIQKLVYVDCPKYFYRMNPSGLTHTFSEKHYDDTIKVFSMIESDLSDKEIVCRELLEARKYLFQIQSFLNIKNSKSISRELEQCVRKQLKSASFSKEKMNCFGKREQLVIKLFCFQPDIAFWCYKIYKLLNKRDE